MEELKKCPVCDFNQYNSFLSCVDYTVSNSVFNIVECKKCTLKYTNPRPEEENLYKYYLSEDYISHSNSGKGIINFLYKKVRTYTLKQKLKLINNLYSNKGNLLDIGCGTGEFLNICKNNGWNTVGIEPNALAKNFAINKYKLNVLNENSFLSFKEQEFDFITMWHVLEHVPSLNKRIIEINKIIKNNGVLLIAVPNCDSYDAKFYKEHWAAYDVPRHLYHFTPKTIQYLLNKHGFKLIETKPMKFDSYYVSLLSEKHKKSFLKIIKGFYRGFISNLKANKNTYSSQIFIFEKTK